MPTRILWSVVTHGVARPEPVAGDGRSVAKAPDGSPVTVSLTRSAKPLTAVIATVKLPDEPRRISLAGQGSR